MANHPSALKRQRQSEARRRRFKSRKHDITDLKKDVLAAAADKKTDLLKTLQSKVAKFAQKGNMHKNTAARIISRLAKFIGAQSSAKA